MRKSCILIAISLVFCLNAAGQTVNRVNLLEKLIDLPAPAPFTLSPEKATEEKERKPEFFDEETPPPDDAPIEDLLAYWENGGSSFPTQYRPKPSAKTLERILEYCDEHPERTSRHLGIFPAKPEVAEAIKAIYEKLEKAQSGDTYRIKEWLKYNSTVYLDELVKGANGIKDENNYVQNPNQYLLRALARVDWDRALPIVQRLENDPTNPHSQILAKWVTYQHAIDTGDSSTMDSYRNELKKLVENRSLPPAQRDLAMDALTLGGDFDGRDEWYLSLLEDETLLSIQEHGYTGLTTMVALSPRKKWLEKMIELTKSTNLTVRSAAARNLMDVYKEGNAEVLKALLPWLANAGWAKQSGRSERSALIKAFGETVVPEAVPSLISIVMNEEQHQAAAAKALAKYKDPRAIPALRSVLATQETPFGRNIFISALVDCGGFSDEEQMAALEAYATQMSTPEGSAEIETYEQVYGGRIEDYDEEDEEEEETAAERQAKPEKKPIPLQISIGGFIGAQEEPGEGLVRLAIQRQKVLQRTNPPVAAVLAGIMEKWRGRAIYIEIMRRIGAGESSIDDVLLALANRKEMREKVPSELALMRGGGVLSRAIGACIAEDHSEYLSILGGTEPDGQTAMLGCTRLLRAPLPVREVGELLNSTDKTTALAAERYLESEDSLEARKMVLAKNKNASLILGARTAFVPDVKTVYTSFALASLFQSVTGAPLYLGEVDVFKKKEDELRRELTGNPDMLAVYGILPSTEPGRKIIRVYKDKIVFTYYEDSARYWEKTLTKKEYDEFYNVLIENNIDGLQPITQCRGGCVSNEFVMFGRDGGRRVYYASYGMPPPLDKIDEIFGAFIKSEGIKLHYVLADKVPGLEVLWTDQDVPARAVWAQDADIRFLAEDKAREKEIEKETEEKIRILRADSDDEVPDGTERLARYRLLQKQVLEAKYAHFGWRKIENGRPAGPAAQPPDAPFLYDHTQVPEIPGIRNKPRSWQARAGTSEIRTGEYYEPGLFKVAPGQDPAVFKEGMYSLAIVTGDGRWAIAAKTEEEPKEFDGLVRVNLQTGREFKLNLPASENSYPIAFVASHNKMLVFVEAEDEPDESETPAPRRAGRPARTQPRPKPSQYYLVDAATGAVQPVKGVFRPLEDQTYRPLQPTGIAGESWGAIYDPATQGTTIGRYNEKTFAFKTVLNIPSIKLDSMDIWVDEKPGKIYFVYQGHLLSLPMK
jgi:hypothetical protein